MPVTSHTAIRAKIKQILVAVADAGVVNDHEPYADQLSALKAKYVTGGKLCGWHIQRVNFKRRQPYQGRVVIDTQWRLTHLRAIDEEGGSELALDTHVDAAAQAFHADQTLGGVIDHTWLEDRDVCGLQLDSMEPVMFCGVLCHRARCTLFTRHKE
jgi:hypothetical protein